tara:strand:+ start:750 stop:1889 length:1140 start_codon:yes stop_codon:yes gene_type:complete
MVDLRTPSFDRPGVLRHVDLLLPLLSIALAVIGTLMVYSATRGPATDLRPAETTYMYRQGLFVVVGIGVMVIAAWFGHRRVQRLAIAIYVGLLGTLIGVLIFGVEVKGTRGWFEVGDYQLQPSEFGKIALITALAAVLGSSEDIGPFRLAIAVVVAGLPIAAILLQPDLGTILVYGAISAGMFLVSGVSGQFLLVLGLLLLTGLVAVLQSDVLAEYQISRLLVFVDEETSTAASYNLEQAQIAIGNGGLAGQGLFEGTQNNSDLVPEQQTDFIFTVIAEETGFVGSAAVLVVIALLLVRVWRIGRIADDKFGLLLAAGVFSMLSFQVFQSVGMSTGIMPITGIPLPLISYGGSSILSTFLAIGLVESVHMRRHQGSSYK